MGKSEDTEIESSNYEHSESEHEGEDTSQELRQELEDTKKRADEYLDSFQRLQAEFANYKKRSDREKADLMEYANTALITELIDVLENLERGVASAKDSEDTESVVKGMEMVYSQLKRILDSKGLTHIEAVGKKFDPYFHEAMMKTPADDCPNNTVIEEFERGYKVKDRVVRYSKVRVSVNENKKNNNTNN